MSPAAATVPALDLLRGSSRSFEIALLDGLGLPESVSGVDRASFRIMDKAVGGTVILARDTVAGDLTLDGATSVLTATLSQPEADALPVGDYIGDVAIHFTTGDNWFHSDPVVVKIRPSIAHHPAP